MPTLGSTSKPATTQEWTGLNTLNQQAIALTMPAGGPWLITRVGVWAAGQGSSCSAKLCIWSGGGTLLRSTGTVTFAGAAFALGNSFNYEANLTSPYEIAGGASVIVGWSRNPAGAVQWGLTGSGTHYDDTQTGSYPGNLTGFTTHSGQIGAYIEYEAANDAPNAPTLSSPANAAILTDLTPTFLATASDPDGDPVGQYDIQVSTDPTFASVTHWSATSQTDGISGNAITKLYGVGGTAAVALSRGATYYWRMRTEDPDGLIGAWSATRSFKINRLPTVTKVSPATTSGLAWVHNLSDTTLWTLGGSHAKPRFTWTYADADGDAQGWYRVRTYAASSGGSPLGDSGQVASSATQHDATGTMVYNTTLYWTVEVWDSRGESSGESPRTAFKVLWSQAIYEYLVPGGASSSGWAFSKVTSGGGQSAFLFASATGASGAGRSAWQTSIGAVDQAAYVNVMVRLNTAVAATTPSVDSMTFSYVASGVFPDRWTQQPGSDFVLDPDVVRFGSQALRCTVSTTTGNRYVYPFTKTAGDDMAVQPHTDYVMSAYVKTNAPLTGSNHIRLAIHQPGLLTGQYIAQGTFAGGGATTDTSDHPEGWQRLHLTFNSGEYDTIRPMLHMIHVSGVAGDKFWIDAVQIEAGTVVSPWRPGMVSNASILDVSGVQIDGASGGIFRLRGSGGTATDTVELGANGLVLGGPLYGSGSIVLGDFPNVSSSLLNLGSMELRAATPYIDFSNDNAIDYDARIRLTSDDVLAVEAADLTAANLAREFAFGTVNVSIAAGAASGNASVTFPFTFPVTPIVVVAVGSLPANSSKMFAKFTAASTTGFTAYLLTGDATNSGTLVTVAVHWMAGVKTSGAAAG